MPHRILIYDTTAGNLTSLWRAGASLASNFFDEAQGVASTSEFYSYLSTCKQVTHIQLWCHGAPGRPVISDRGLSAGMLAPAFADVSLPGASLWLRCCNLLQGPAGYTFAQDFCKSNRSLIGHIRLVSWPSVVSQSGCYGLRPSQEPYWPIEDQGYSYPWVANTVGITRLYPPEWVWRN